MAAVHNHCWRCSAPMSSTSRRGAWPRACSPAPDGICAADGRLFLYGPFKRDGKHTALSNAVFDSSLREGNPEWGVRDIADLEKLAASAGLTLREIVEMPANNLILVFGRRRLRFAARNLGVTPAGRPADLVLQEAHSPAP